MKNQEILSIEFSTANELRSFKVGNPTDDGRRVSEIVDARLEYPDHIYTEYLVIDGSGYLIAELRNKPGVLITYKGGERDG